MRRFSLATAIVLLLGCAEPPAEGANTNTPETDAESPAAAPAGGPVEAGTIKGTLGGEAGTWTALYRKRDSGADATSTYQTRRIGNIESYSLSVAGHVGTSMSPDGSLRISVMGTESFDACPCTVNTGTIEYVVDLPDEVWEAREATMTIDVFYQNGDGTFGAEGSFSGTLAWPEGGSEETIPVEGTFDVRRIQRVGQGT